MHPLRLFTLTAWALAAIVPLVPQTPDLTGTWVAAPDPPPGLPAAPGAILGARFAIGRAGPALTLARPSRDGVLATTFVPGGREVRSVVPGPTCIGDSTVVETLGWEADALVLTVVGTQPAGATAPTKVNNRRLIRRTGADAVVVEGTLTQGGQSRQVGTLYRRSAETLTPTPPKTSAQPAPATIDAVNWVAGTWATSGTASITEERWTPPAGGSMLGTARTMRGASLASFEFLCIVERGGGLVYQAMPGARSPATDFVMTSFTATDATFENPGHDYPKKIRYALLPDGSLQTEVSGEAGSRVITAVLKRH